MSERCLVLIDGSSFYFKLKDLKLQKLLLLNFTKFVQLLSRSQKLVGVCYYIGRIRQDGSAKTKSLFDAQQPINEQDAKQIDELAKLMLDPDANFEELQKLWESKKEFRLLKGGLL